MAESRLEREAEFHDSVSADGARVSAARFYAVATGKEFYFDLIRRAVGEKGGRVLEYGCGPGGFSFDLAREGSIRVDAVDISSVGIEQGRERAINLGLSDRMSFHVMDAEQLTFGDSTFDAVFGSGILHHLNITRALREVARVLKPDGRAIFFEPLGHNFLINMYRRLTPRMRSEDEHPLLMDDLAVLSQSFQEVELRFFHLISLLAVPLRKLPGFSSAVRFFDWLDQLLFKLPILRRQAWVVVIEMSGPSRASAGDLAPNELLD